MQLNKREKRLAAAVGAAAIVLGGWLLLDIGGPSRGGLRAKRDQLAGEIQKKQSRVAAARRAAADLAAWKRRSLPADPAHARSLYQAWLRELVDRAALRQPNVESSEGQSRRNGYTLFSFTVRGRAELAALTQFLYDFYSAGHLHKISRLDVKAVEGSGDLDVSMTIEALALADADRKDRLSDEPGGRLKLAKLADYRDLIVGRNLFAPPKPPAPSPAETPPSIDRAKHTFVVAVVNADGRDEVWLMDRVADKLIRLQAGNAFEAGPVRGRVKSISLDRSEAVLEIDGRERRIKVGKSLGEGIGPSPQSAPAEVIQDRPPRGRKPAPTPPGALPQP